MLRANDAARKATDQQPANPDAWWARGTTSYQLDNNADAESSLLKAISIDPNKARNHRALGDVYFEIDLVDRALAEHTRASELDPGNAYYATCVGFDEFRLGNVDKGHNLIKDAYERQPDDEKIQRLYGQALLEMIASCWSTDDDGWSTILTENQLIYTKERLATIDTLEAFESEEFLMKARQIAMDAEQVKFRAWSDGLGKIVKWSLSCFIASLVLIFLMNEALAIVLCVAAGVLGILFIVNQHRMPGWKWNRKHSPPHVRNTGLQ